MKIHYLNRDGKEKFLTNIIHLQNIDDKTFIATLKDGKEYSLKVSRIEGIYYKDNSTEDNDKTPSLLLPIINDSKVSLKAKGLYMLIYNLLQIPNFKIIKKNIQKLSTDGETAFNSAWTELIEQEYLKVYKFSSGKGFTYEYELIK